MKTTINGVLDNQTQHAIQTFLQRLADEYQVSHVILFGSRAQQHHRPDSDVDLALLLHGPPREQRLDIALRMAALSFDILLDTGILIEALPIWEDEWQHPETFPNPALLENIRRDGIHL